MFLHLIKITVPLMFCVFRFIAAGLVLLLAFQSSTARLYAQEPSSYLDQSSQNGTRVARWETWFGATAGRESWSAYTGTTLSPFGAITAEGWRLRYVGGYGAYTYDGSSSGGPLEYDATFGFSDLLIGYQKQFGALTAKAFAGPSAITHTIRPPDPDFRNRSEFGVKGALELWFNMSDVLFVKSDVAAAYYFDNAEQFHHVSWRAAGGLRIASDFKVGAEGALITQRSYESYEAGLFAGYQWHALDLTLAGGAIKDDTGSGAYVRGSIFVRY